MDQDPVWISEGRARLVERDRCTQCAGPSLLRAPLGTVEVNPLYRPPGFGVVWLQRHPTALTMALVAILALVAALVLRPARRTKGV
jgi:hypothetical protein